MHHYWLVFARQLRELPNLCFLFYALDAAYKTVDYIIAQGAIAYRRGARLNLVTLVVRDKASFGHDTENTLRNSRIPSINVLNAWWREKAPFCPDIRLRHRANARDSACAHVVLWESNSFYRRNRHRVVSRVRQLLLGKLNVIFPKYTYRALESFHGAKIPRRKVKRARARVILYTSRTSRRASHNCRKNQVSETHADSRFSLLRQSIADLCEMVDFGL